MFFSLYNDLLVTKNLRMMALIVHNVLRSDSLTDFKKTRILWRVRSSSYFSPIVT